MTGVEALFVCLGVFVLFSAYILFTPGIEDRYLMGYSNILSDAPKELESDTLAEQILQAAAEVPFVYIEID